MIVHALFTHYLILYCCNLGFYFPTGNISELPTLSVGEIQVVNEEFKVNISWSKVVQSCNGPVPSYMICVTPLTINGESVSGYCVNVTHQMQ